MINLYPQHSHEASKSPRPTLAETISAREAPMPWTQRDNISPIYDALGKVVSFTQHGPRIVAAVNLLHELARARPQSAMQAFGEFSRRAADILEIGK